jgi:NTE family protein
MDMTNRPRTPLRKPLEPIKALARPGGCDGIGLVLQGGGALGAYQAGVYQALHEAGLEPDWVVGVSIGAINSAIIAGNPPERRLEKLENSGWTSPRATPPPPGRRAMRPANCATPVRHERHAVRPARLLQAQPTSMPGSPPRLAKAATAFYDTSPLHKTLEKLVDFDLINDGQVRFAVGAVNVATANFAYFDNADTDIAPNTSWPAAPCRPLCPWCASASIITGMAASSPTPRCSICWTIAAARTCWSSRWICSPPAGDIPRDMPEVLSRQKDIQYSSRTRTTTDHFLETHRLKQALRDALDLIPMTKLSEEQRKAKSRSRTPARDQHHAADLPAESL